MLAMTRTIKQMIQFVWSTERIVYDDGSIYYNFLFMNSDLT